MARGWESKSVESQMDDAAERKRSAFDPMPVEDKHASERGLLQLSITRILHQLETCQNDRYRDLLDRSLKDLREKMGHLDPAPAPPIEG